MESKRQFYDQEKDCPADYGQCIADIDCKREKEGSCPIMQRKQDEFPVVCLCGSTKFRNEYIETTRILTMQGFIVLGVGLFSHCEQVPLTDNMKQMLDRMHLAKIDMSDEVIIINPGGYIGESTRNEIEYAKKTGKPITYAFGGEIDERFDGLDVKKAIDEDDYPISDRTMITDN